MGMKGDGLNRFSDERLHECELSLGRSLTQTPVPLPRYMNGNLIAHCGCWCARTRRVSEDVKISKRWTFTHADRFVKLGIGLAGEADHDIGPDACGGHGSADL